jgi:Rrf2 family protein
MAKIVNITEAVTIALHSVILIAKHRSKQANVNYIAKATGSSKFHIAKVLQKLVKDGFLGSTRGPAGGFYLVDEPKNITLLEVYESVEGKIIVSRCPLGKEICPFGKCVFENLTMDMTRNFKDYLGSRTLASYMKDKDF